MLAAIEEDKTDLVIIGALRPVLQAFDLCRAIDRRWPDLPVIMTSWNTDDELVVADAAHAGASACVDATISCDEILATIRRVLSGALLFPRHLVQYAHNVEPLSPREREVLALVAEGRETAQIAVELGVAVDTVRNHETNARSKLGVHTTADAAARAERRGMLD